MEPKLNALLYDTGSTDHIINDRRWFVNFSSGQGNLPVIRTGGGPIIPRGRGTAEFMVLAEPEKGYFTRLTLKNALYLPQVSVNIVSGLKHYEAGGTLIKETLYGPNHKPCGGLNVAKYGFFMKIKGFEPPRAHSSNFCHILQKFSGLRAELPHRMASRTPTSVEPSRTRPVTRPEKYTEVPDRDQVPGTPQLPPAEMSGDKTALKPPRPLSRREKGSKGAEKPEDSQ